jgi:hypothetical protein
MRTGTASEAGFRFGTPAPLDTTGRYSPNHAMTRMNGWLPVPALLAVLFAGSTAHAESGAEAFELDVRAAVALPFGTVNGSTGNNLNQTFAFAIPLMLDIGYRVDSSLFIGAYGSYAFASPANALRSDCAQCSVADMRLGIEAQIHSGPARTWDPWVGLGSGYEWAKVNSTSDQLSTSGWEILHAEAGIDLRAGNAAGLGPFVTGTVGQYDYESLPGQGATAVTNRSLHEWFMFGLRGIIDIQGARGSYQSSADSTER